MFIICKVKCLKFVKINFLFESLISIFEIHHKKAFLHYLLAKGYDVTENKDTIRGNKEDKTVIAKFDKKGRLKGLGG